MVKNDREYRNMTIEIRQPEEGEEQRQVVVGYASTFNQPYKLLSGEGWELWETVEREAFDNTDMTDVIMQYNHEGRVFARTRNNTLKVEPDDKGLFIEADLSGTEIGRELYEEIAGGYTDRMSFGFTVTGDSEERQQNDNGIWIYTRHINSIGKLFDVSAVSLPANDGTSIAADPVLRSIGNIADGVIERIQAERLEEEKRALEQKRAEGKLRAKALGGQE